MLKPENDTAAEMRNDVNAFLRRRSDGKFFRGARWWRWCKSWRSAAVLPIGFWERWIFPKLKDAEVKDVEFAFLDDVE